MSRTNKKKNEVTVSETDTFVVTFPLITQPWQREKLNTLFRCCNILKNNVIAKASSLLKDMLSDERYAAIKEGYKAFGGTDKSAFTAEQRQHWKELAAMSNALRMEYGLTAYQIEALGLPTRRHYSAVIPSHVGQKMVQSVAKAVDSVLYGNGEELHFSKIDDLRCISNKDNLSGFRYKDGKVLLTIGRKKLVMPIRLNRKDKYGYEGQALRCPVRYCSLERRPYPDGWHYFVQLTLRGTIPVKVNPDTGELLYPLGTGNCGHDIGPQTLASCGNEKLSLNVLAEDVERLDAKLWSVNRAMDRSRRTTNPAMFKPNGTIVPIDELPDGCTIIVRGKKRRKWVKSNRYRQMERERLWLYDQTARRRKESHNRLANKLLSYGEHHYIEMMDWRALAKRAKDAEPKDDNTKRRNRCKKRLGKSVSKKSPGTFEQILGTKVARVGGTFRRINTAKCKASQYNHLDHTYVKKNLSKRWNIMPDGTKVQRDIYSAFLIQHTNDTLDGFNQAALDRDYPSFLRLHDAVIASLSASSKVLPSSIGI